MQKKVVKGTTENLNMLNEKVDYIGFKLGEVPDFLKEFEPLKYNIPREYDETTYKVYKYIPIDDIEILITTNNRLDELGERYKNASPLFTYMKAENNEDIEKYAHFLKMINEIKMEEMKEIENEQESMEDKIPFEVKFPNNFKWQIYYSDYANKYFMLASTEESDNSPLFYLLKRKIEQNKSKKGTKVFVPISNEEYSERILKRSDIEDLENYLWYFTKNWASIYEVTDKNQELSLQIVGEAKIYDKMTSKYNLTYTEKKEAIKEYNLIKALFILSYDIQNEYVFETKINDNGNLTFFYNGEEIKYSTLPEFLKKQAIIKIEENNKIKLETKELKADIKDLQKHSEEQNEEYLRQENQIYTFLECKKTFFGRVRYFFKNKKKPETEEESKHSISKTRMQDILENDKNKEKPYDNTADPNKLYTVEDIIKICKELNESIKENKNTKSDIRALKNKIENLDRKISNAEQYIEEIEKHRRSIFDFWKFANRDETKVLNEGKIETKETKENLKRTFNYDDDIDTLASEVDKQQRQKLTEKELNATFIADSLIDGINLISKKPLSKSDSEKIEKMLEDLKAEYKNNIEKIQKKDFDIFGNVAEDKTKIKLLNNTEHRESEKDKFKILNVNLNTTIDEFIEKLKDTRDVLEEESNKIETPYDISIYKASNEKLNTDGFSKFDLNPQETLETLEKDSNEKEIYLYKINVPEKANLIFYSNIMFYENINGTLPLGMDISQEILINMNKYNLVLKDKEEFNINVCSNEYNALVKKVKVYEYDITKNKNIK